MSDPKKKLANVRRAVRLLAAYHTRLLDCLQRIEAEAKLASPGLSFQRWEPSHHATIDRPSTSPLRRWGWDFVPLQDTWFRWTTDGEDGPKKPGHVALWVQHVVDDGYDTTVKGHRGPDPTRFKDADDCDSWLMVCVYAMVEGACTAKWDEIDAAFEDAVHDDIFWNGQIHDLRLPEGTGNGAGLRSVGWRMKVDEIGTENELASKILVPLGKYLGEILAG